MSRFLLDNKQWALPAGTSLKGGAYIIDGLMGVGDFTFTYKAHSATNNRFYVIKEHFLYGRCVRVNGGNGIALWSIDGNLYNRYMQRFVEETQQRMRTRNPNLVPIIDLFSENGTGYYVMPFVAGESLSQRMQRRHVMSYEEAYYFFYTTGLALRAMHVQGLVHREVSPDNIIVDMSGSPMLVDYGSPREFPDDPGRRQPSWPEGFSAYEQYNGQPPMGPYTDIYSLAAVFYYCVTSTLPTPALSSGNMASTSLRAYNGKVSDDIDARIMKALELLPENRQSSLDELFAGLPYAEMPVIYEEEPVPAYSAPYTQNADSRTTIMSQDNARLMREEQERRQREEEERRLREEEERRLREEQERRRREEQERRLREEEERRQREEQERRQREEEERRQREEQERRLREEEERRLREEQERRQQAEEERRKREEAEKTSTTSLTSNTSSPTSPTTSTIPTPNNSKGKKRLLPVIIIAAVVLLLGGGAAVWFLMSGKDSSWDSTVQTGTFEAYYAYVQKNSGIQDEEVQNHITEACRNMLELSSGNMDNLKLLSEVGTGEIADKAYSQLVNLACDSLAAVSARLANMVGDFDVVVSQMNSYYEITDAALSDNRGTLNEREKKHIHQVQSDAVSTVDVQLSSQLRAHKIAEDDLLLEAKANIKALVAYKGLPVATVEDANNQLSQK